MPARLDRRIELPGGKHPLLANLGKLYTAIGRRSACLVEYRVTLLADDHVVARLGEDLESDLIGHGAAGHEQGRLFREQGSDTLLQRVDRRILAVLVITHRRPCHGFAHSG